MSSRRSQERHGQVARPDGRRRKDGRRRSRSGRMVRERERRRPQRADTRCRNGRPELMLLLDLWLLMRLLLLVDELLLLLLLVGRLQDFGVALDLDWLVMSPPRRSRLCAFGRGFGRFGPRTGS